MYVYQKSPGVDVWTVGFFRPDGKWEPESDRPTAERAAARIHWLNGGNWEGA